MPDPKNTVPAHSRKGILTQSNLDDITKTSEENTKRRGVEAMASKDSIVASNKAKLFGKPKDQQGTEGNQAANRTRVAGGNPKVIQSKSVTNNARIEGDNYTSKPVKATLSYNREAPLEKEMPKAKYKRVEPLDNAKKFVGK
jgi:hypothetical protein